MYITPAGKPIKHHRKNSVPMRKQVYSGKILGLSVHNVKIEGREVVREIVEHRGAAAMLGFDENGDVILVRQHRYPHGYILEIPAGTLEEGEDPAECAHREMIEETGYRAREMTHLLTYYPSIGYNTEKIHCYVASGLEKIAEPDPGDGEFITVVKMSMKRLIGMIKNGEIQDSKTICAIMIHAVREGLV